MFSDTKKGPSSATAKGDEPGGPMVWVMRPNVRVNRPAKASAVSPG